MIRRLALRNLLSFGPDTPELSLGPLNVLIGPNGSGKSNFVASLALLRAAPRDLAAPIRETGGVGEWLHKCASRVPSGTLEAVVEYPAGRDACVTASPSKNSSIASERATSESRTTPSAPAKNRPGGTSVIGRASAF